MTKSEKRAVLLAVAKWEPTALSVGLLQRDREDLRDQVAMELAPVLGMEAEAAMATVGALRMTDAVEEM